MSKNWTEEQLSAIETTDCNLLVSAAAGSGKTAVLVERIIRFLCNKECPLDIDRLLVVTFTEAAAAEMRERIADALEKEITVSHRLELKKQLSLINGATISTLHAFCLEVIQRYFYLLELDPAFRVADELEASMLRQEVMDSVFEEAFAREEENFLELAAHYGGKHSDEGLVEMVLKLYQFAWSNPDPTAWLSQVVNLYALAEEDNEKTLQIWLRPIKAELELSLSQSAAALREALGLCALPGAPLIYEKTINKELAQVNMLQELLNGSWQRLREAWLGITFERLRPAKDAEEELKERVKALRQRAKDLLNISADTYFTRTLEQYTSEIKALMPLLSALAELVTDFGHAYGEAKKQAGLLDFNDLEHYCLNILRAEKSTAHKLLPSAAAQELRARYEHVLVDEYQDINPVQDAILRLVSRQGEEVGNLFMVGDVKQSIYRFRLGDPSIFLEKYHSYGTKKRVNKKILLCRNFRCRAKIVSAVNYLFAKLMSASTMEIEYDQEASLVYGANYPLPDDQQNVLPEEIEVLLLEKSKADTKITNLTEAENAEELAGIEYEGIVVAEKIVNLLEQNKGMHVFDKEKKCYRPLAYRDIVILLRSTTKRANYLVDILARYNIPASADLSSGYFAATEVETMLSLLKVLDNPRQDIALAAVLRSPIGGFSLENLAVIRKLGGNNVDFWQALQVTAAAQVPDLSAAIVSFIERLDSWRSLARREKLASVIAALYRETGYADYVAGLPDGLNKQANLRALFSRARQFDRFSRQGLTRFLLFIDELRAAGEDLGTARSLSENEDVVRIMSIHKSKGLEFPVVFLCDLGKKFNFQDMRAGLLMHRHYGLAPLVVSPTDKIRYPSLPYLALRLVGEAETRAEEMRILYVALTRAREKLYLIGSAHNLSDTLTDWQQNSADTKVPDYYVCKATSYLDWLGRALTNYPKDTFSVTCLEKPAGAATVTEKDDQHGVREALLSLQPLPGEVYPEISEKIKEIFAYNYPAGQPLLPAKLSVTEIKRRFSQHEGEEGETTLFPALPWTKPAFVENKEHTPLDIGLLYHTVLQHLDITMPCDEAGVANQMQNLVEQGILPLDKLKLLEPAKVAAFFNSSIGQLVLDHGKQVLREWPFTMALPAVEVASDTATVDDYVVIQGIIDLLIPLADGYIVVDYKTDRLPAGGLEELRQRYQLQLTYYGRAVETILKAKVEAAYLYVFSAATFVRVY